MGHSSDTIKKPLKFSQWLRDARTVFQQQPHRRFCFGVIFLKPDAYLCYADHGCAAFSEPLKLTPLSDGSGFLVKFLTSFLKSSDRQRGRDPLILEENATTILKQGVPALLDRTRHLLLGRCCWAKPPGLRFRRRRLKKKRNLQVFVGGDPEH